jgi:hypothetical protein
MYKPKELKVYCCAECFEVQVKTSTPKIKGCKKSSFHRWTYMGERGPDRYMCSVCGIKINTLGVPTGYGCKEGRTHKWTKVIPAPTSLPIQS